MNRKEIEQILKAATKHGADFAELFWEHKETTAIGCEENRIERILSGIDEGAGIRVIYNNSSSYAYTNEVNLKRLLEVAELAGKAAQKQRQAVAEPLCFHTPSAHIKLPVEIAPGEIKIEDKTKKVLEANNAARRVDKRIRQVSVGYQDVRQKVNIANSEGVYVEDLRTRTRLSVNVVAGADGVVQTGYQAVAGTVGFELFAEHDPHEIGEAAANRAVLMLSARNAPQGKMPVVLDSKAGGTMIHEACGHGLEADLVQKGLSVYAGKKEEQVASTLVTVVDDGLLPKKYGSYRYDDEGCPAQKTLLIENGVLKEFMYDYQTARQEKRASTGNGRRESYHSRPLPRMRNTYIAPGKTSPESIIREVKEGLLVRAMGGGQVNTTTGDYVFDVAEGYIIKDGEIQYPVRGATLTGNGPETLRLIEMVGSDFGFAVGVCGKGGQGVPVADAQPTLAVRELIVGGRNAAERKDPMIRRL